MNFVWDDLKNDANKKKHNVSFAEAATAFGAPMLSNFLILTTRNEKIVGYWLDIRQKIEFSWLSLSKKVMKLFALFRPARPIKMKSSNII